MARKHERKQASLSEERTAVPALAVSHAGRVNSSQANSERNPPPRRALLSGAALSILAAAAIAQPAPSYAQDFHWDGGTVNGGDPAANANGGAGTWNTALTNWDSLAVGGTDLAWINGDNNAIFGGAAGTVTLGAPITAGDLTFNVPGYTLSGNTLTFTGADPTITLTGGAGNTNINSVIAGTDGLTIDGGGSTNRLLFFNAANTFTGGLTIDSGRLVANAANALNGANNVVTVNNGGALQVNHSNAFGGDTDAANLILNDGANLWLGDQNLTHDVTLTGGTVRIDDPFNSGIASTWTGSTVLTADTTIRVANTGNNTTFAGNLTDTGANRLSLLLDEGGGIDSTLFLTGTNSFTGGVTVNNGQLFATGADALGGGAGNVVTLNGGILRVRGNAFGGDTDASQLIVNDGALLRVDTNHTLNHDVTLTGGTANIDGLGNATWNGTAVLTADTLLSLGVGNHTLNVTGNLSDNGGVLSLQTVGSTVRFTGDLSFSGDFTIDGVNTWFDGGTHAYTGDTIITDNARLLLNSAGTLSPNSNFRFEGTNSAATTIIYGTGAVPLIDMANGAGGGELRWNGTGGFYALDAANGGADVTVNLGGAGATLTWDDGLFVPDGHALILGTNQTNGNAREVDFQNGIDLNSAVRMVRADNGNINDHAIISGVLSGTGGLQVVGNGALELTATNTYSGATVIGDAATNGVGALILGGADALSSNSNLQFNGFTDSDGVTNAGFLMLTATSGDFTRPLGTGAGEVQWTASGGFGAIGGERTVDIGGAGATLTWGAGGFVGDGDVLRFGGRFSNSTINWENGIDLGASDRTINANEGAGSGFGGAGDLEVNLNGVIEGDGGLVLVGAGDVALNALNTYAGTTYIGGVNVGGTDNQMVVWANTLADAGAASSLGAGATVVLASHVGGLIYTGAAAGSNRTLALNETSGGIHHLFNRGSGAITWTGDVATTGSGFNTLRLGGTFESSDLDGNGVADDPNIISGVISDGSGVTQIQGAGGNCAAGNVWRLTGANTFTGQFNPLGCTFEVTTLGNAGDASSVGAGDLIADYRSGNGTVRYVGTGESTDRLFWAWGDSHLESSGAGPIALTNTGLIVDRNGGFNQWLGGTNPGDNLFAPTLVNGATPAEFHNPGNIFNLGKEGSGLWALVTDNNAHANAYVGHTRIFGGALRLDNAGAVTGGLGVASSHGATGSSERSSLIRFEGATDGTAGVLGLTAASGGFFRGLTTAGLSFINNNGTTVGADPDGAGPLPAFGVEALDDDNYVQGVRWIGSGGFAAWDGVQVVNLFGDDRELTWGAGGFVPNNHQLVFGYETADGTVDFQNAVNLGGAARTILVNDGLAARDAVMSGVLRSTNALGGLTKIGEGTLTLTANNTFTGVTTVSAGVLELGDGGTTGSLGGSPQVVVAAGASLVANHSNIFTLSQNIIGAGALIQQGTGTTILTDPASSIGDVDINAGALEIDGSLETPTVSMLNGTTLQVDGTMQQAGATQTVITGSAGANTVRIGDGGTLLATADLGAGADVLDVAGTLDTGAGAFSLGGGGDLFRIHDGISITGAVDGGAGVDDLVADIATAADLGALTGFETLTKLNVGTLNVNGPDASSFQTVAVQGGVLNIATGGSVTAPSGSSLDTTVASGATLNVNGAFGCGASDDTLAVSGTIAGSGVIDLCAGNDVLTLNDGARLNNTIIGGPNGAGDIVVLNNAALMSFDASRTEAFERLIKRNAGDAKLVGAQTYSVDARVEEGVLSVNGVMTTPITEVLAAGVLGGSGTIVGDVSNLGVVAPGNSIDTLLIVGNYAGAGGTLDIEAELTGTGSPADRLLITGDVTGTSLVTVIPLADNGAVTGDGPTDGISIIQVGGMSTANVFQLDGGYVASGPYQLVLNSFDKPESAASELDPRMSAEGVGDFWDYRLQNLLDEMDEPVPVPQIPAYQGLPSGAFRFGAEMTGALHKRRGEVRHIYQRQMTNGPKSVDVEFYLRSSGGGADMTGKDGPDYYQDSWFTQLGGDGAHWINTSGSSLRSGLMFTYGRSKLDIADTSAEADLEAKSLAFSSTYQSWKAWYVDMVAYVTRYDAEVTTAERGEAAAPNGWGSGVSFEAGRQIALGDHMALEPQAQLSYQHVDFEQFTDVDRLRVDLQGGHSLTGRAGARFMKTYVAGSGGGAKLITPYVEANVVHEFLDAEPLIASNVAFGTDLGGTRLLAGAGVNAQLDRRIAAYANASWQEGLGRGSADAWTATVGFRLNY